ncbi:hypothetical protein [Aliiruegeria lutimaris]|uniref:Uncharacterized protein n=1 Tax=Aliiruegeria lutimaris TaxID=571298 RepID=A0A1G9IMQ1_9RHOB|nr:hypothetical protein [Aliiruegeria lutimaris]SDL26538.1 hypothetical protein SAMN04488026_107517 [Aliiruegeria lutimaris]
MSRVLAFVAARRRVAYVFLVDGNVRDWRVSEKAAKSSRDAAELTQVWINGFTPDILVTEKIDEDFRKGPRVKAIVRAIANIAAHNYLLDVSVKREQRYRNKYEEAEALAALHPEIAAWLPKKRRFFDHEPRNIVLFEALSLAQAVLDDPSVNLAKAMG